MSKAVKLVVALLMVVVLLTGVGLVGCGDDNGKDLGPLKAPTMSVYQYLKGVYSDFNDALLNSMAESSGAGAANAIMMGGALRCLPYCYKYANLDATQKDVVAAALGAFMDTVDANIEAWKAGTATLEANPAYVQLKDMKAWTWYGKVAGDGWDVKSAFLSIYPDSSGAGNGACDFRQYMTTKLHDAGTITGTTYTALTFAERELVDEAVDTFFATAATDFGGAMVAFGTAMTTYIMTNDMTAYNAAVAFANTYGAMYSAPWNRAYADYLKTNNCDLYSAAVAAGMGALYAPGGLISSEIWTLLCTLNMDAANGWKADIEAGTHSRQAFFRWIVKPALAGMKSAAIMIQLAVGEFTIKIDNQWEGTISIDNMSVNVSMKSDGFGFMPERDVDVGKLAVGDKMFVPPEGVMVKLAIPIKAYDVLVWLVMAGLDGTAAGTYAADCWAKISPYSGTGTPTFTVTIEATISSTGVDTPETITQNYTMEWVTP